MSMISKGFDGFSTPVIHVIQRGPMGTIEYMPSICSFGWDIIFPKLLLESKIPSSP
nr:hypothetical protein Q903MT_gene1075 [Picea sitchensis]